jgi:acetyl esterase/lipase
MTTSPFLSLACSLAAAALFLATAAGGRAATPPAQPAAPSAAAPARKPDVLIVSRTDASKYKVDGNIAYDKHPATILDMLYPKEMVKNDPSGKKYPGVIMFHGGGWIRTSKSTMSTFYNRYLAHEFVVCNADYRMADPTGQFQPENALAPAAVEDSLRAAKWFYDHADEYNVDKSRIIVTGASAGGHLALMVGLCTDEKLGPCNPKDFKIAAIVNGYGAGDVADLIRRKTNFAMQWIPESLANREEIIKEVNPMTYVRKDAPPMITVQGSRDNVLPVADNQRLTDALKAAGAQADIHLVEGAGHGYQSPVTAWPDAEKTTFEWLAKQKIIPSAEH